MDDVARSIADPARRAILSALAERPLSAGDIAAMFPVTRPAVSRHLRVLRESGLVAARVDGRRRVYAIDVTPLAPLVAWLASLDPPARWDHRLDALETEVHRAGRDRRAAALPGDPAGAPASTEQEETA